MVTVSQGQINELTRLEEVDKNLYTYQDNQHIEKKKQARQAFWHVMELVGTFLVAATIYYVGLFMKLRVSNRLAYEWYEGKKMKSCTPDKEGRYGYKKGGVEPTGKYRFSMTCVCLSENYAFLSGVLNGVGLGCGMTLKETQTNFLLLILQVLFRDITALHWCGGPEQLGHANAKEWVSSWEKWDVAENPFQWLFAKDEFGTSVAILQAQKTWEGSYLDSLFYGGICNVAVEQYNDKDMPTDMVKMLLGSEPVYYRSCYDQRMANAISEGAKTSSTTLIVAGIAKRVGRGIRQAEKAEGGIRNNLGKLVKPGELDASKGEYSSYEAKWLEKSDSDTAKAIRAARSKVSDVADNAKSAFEESKVGKLVKGAKEGVDDAAEKLTSKASDIVDQATSKVSDLAEPVTSKVGNLASKAASKASDVAENLSSKVTNSDVVQNLTSKVGEVGSKVGKANEAVDNVTSKVTGKIEDLKSVARQKVTDAASKAKDALKGGKSGAEAADSAGDTAEGAAEGAAEGVADVAGEAAGEAATEATVDMVGGEVCADAQVFESIPIIGAIIALAICSIAILSCLAALAGLAAGAAAALNFKCKGGNYYVLIEKDGKLTREEWNGDPSLLPGRLQKDKKDDKGVGG